MASHIRRHGPHLVRNIAAPESLPAMAPSDDHLKESEKTHSMLRTNLLKLINHKSQHLDAGALKNIGILVTSFDLNSNDRNQGLAYTAPFPLSDLHKIVGRNEPWREYELPKEADVEFCGALEISVLLKTYLRWTKDDGQHYTKWKTRRIDVDNLGEKLYSVKKYAEWRVPFILDMHDTSVPHIGCFLAETGPLEENTLLTSEMICVIVLIASRLRIPGYRCHRIIPVTVLSAAKRKIRVLQAYIDNRDGYIRVRKSQIVNMEGDTRRKTELLLSWAIGSPVGSTRYDQ